MVAAAEIISKPQSRQRFLRSGLRGFRAEITDQRSRITVHYENAEVGSEKLEASGIAAITSVELSSMSVTEVKGAAKKTRKKIY